VQSAPDVRGQRNGAAALNAEVAVLGAGDGHASMIAGQQQSSNPVEQPHERHMLPA
jgi:hypothetical protein